MPAVQHSLSPDFLPVTQGLCRLCLRLKEGQPVVIRELPGALVYAAGLCDAAGSCFQEMEIWLQRLSPAPVFSMGRAAMLNEDADHRWHLIRKALSAAQPDPLPEFCAVDLPQPPVWAEDHGAALTVETRDDALRAAGLPAYSGTVSRCLRVATAEGTVLWHDLKSGSGPWNPGAKPVWNADCGHWFVLPAADMDFKEYNARLSRGHGPAGEKERHTGGFFLTGWRGDQPPLPEILHLKLRALYGAVSAVAQAQEALRAPLLDVSTTGFGVQLPQQRAAWMAGVVLRRPGIALLPAGVPAGDEPVFVLPAETPLSLYLHPSCRPARTVQGTLRLRAVQPAGSGRREVQGEGTLILATPLPVVGDTVLLHVPDLSDQPVQAMVTAADPARGEAALRTLPWLPRDAITQPPPMDIHAAVVPRLGSGADLYALGVMALEVLLCGSGQPLASVLDEALRLVRRVDGEGCNPEEIPAILSTWHRREAAEPWAVALNYTHLTASAPAPDTQGIPAYAWWAVMTWVLKLFSGQWKHAWARNAGDETPHAPHLALSVPLAELQKLVVRTSALVTGDWSRNVEIRERILAALTR